LWNLLSKPISISKRLKRGVFVCIKKLSKVLLNKQLHKNNDRIG
jgi:hypothetical protein